jgi:hypothetical protein
MFPKCMAQWPGRRWTRESHRFKRPKATAVGKNMAPARSHTEPGTHSLARASFRTIIQTETAAKSRFKPADAKQYAR